jgi:uncharacterized Zn-binding protein involved in type VI secretion
MASKAVAREGDTIVHSNGNKGKVVSSNSVEVIVDNKTIGVEGDICSNDGTKIIATTETVFANGKKVLRLADKCGNGGVITVASDTVFAGD